ncbi:MAG: hypothetical protein N4A33_10075 [Bacteriovoracaceae bacterium]|jgi:hypothetical protein|nr:hypothetical protein [Bacteriovoracaceae bacterium]
MSKKVVIVLLSIFALVAIAFGGAIYYVKSEITDEKIRKIVIEQIEDNLDDTSVSIDSVKYEVGRNINVFISKLIIKDEKSKKTLSRVNEIGVKVPIWSILMGGGTVDIDVISPMVVFEKYKNGKDNWTSRIETDDSKEKKDKDIDLNNEKIEVPAFVENSKLNFNLKALTLNISNIDQEMNISVEKVALKGLNLKKSTAYEVKTSFSHNDKDQSFFASTKVVGEFNLGDLIADKDFKLSTIIYIDDIKTNVVAQKIPQIIGKGNITLSKKGKLIFSNSLEIGEVLTTKVNGSFEKGIINLVSLSTQLSLEKANEIAQVSIPQLDLNDSNITISGKAYIDLEKKQFKPDINIKTSKEILFTHKEFGTINSEIEGNIKDSNVDIKVISKLLNGVSTAQIKTKVDPLNLPSKLYNYKPIYIDVVLNNLNFEKEKLQRMIYLGKDKETKVDNAPKESAPINIAKIESPSIFLTISGKDIKMGQSDFSFNYPFKFSRSRLITTQKALTKIDNGSVTFTVDTYIDGNVFTKASFATKKVNFSSMNAFFPPYLKDVTGEFDSSFKASIDMGKTLVYDTAGSLSAKNGSLKGLNIKKMFDDLLGKLKKYVPKEKSTISDKFDSISAKLSMNNSLIKIQSFNMVGNKKSMNVNMNGHLSNMEKESKLKGDLRVKSLDSKIKKISGKYTIPFMLTGNGYGVMPYAKYTTDKLATGAAKKAVNKAKKDIKKKAKKKIKNLIKGFGF